jgi:hypothetical protein
MMERIIESVQDNDVIVLLRASMVIANLAINVCI